MIFKRKINIKCSTEARFILFCAQKYISGDSESEFPEVAQRDINWYHLMKIAHNNGLLQILSSQINRDITFNIPEQLLEIINEYYYKNAQKNLFLLTELLRVNELFYNTNILIISFKCPILDYQNLSMSEINSLNFFAKQEDLSDIFNILTQNGYFPENAEKELLLDHMSEYGLNNAFIYNLDNKFTLKNKNGVKINMHWNLPESDFFLPENFSLYNKKYLFDLKINNSPIKTFSPEILLLLLCIDNKRKYWPNLAKLFDISNLIVNQDIKWQEVYETSARLGVKKILIINLLLIKELFKANIPKIIDNENLKSEKQIVKRIMNRLLSYNMHNLSLHEKISLETKIHDNKFQGIKYAVHALINSNSDKNKNYGLISSLNSFLKDLTKNKNSKINYKFFPTDMDIVKEMLELAEVGSDDVVYDLGCGDGRFIVEAAKRYGAHGVGVDIDPERISESRSNAQFAGVAHKIKLIKSDLMDVNISDASVIIFYLPNPLDSKVLSKIKKEAAPDTRIVSYSFEVDIKEWIPVKTYLFKKGFAVFPMYLWKT